MFVASRIESIAEENSNLKKEIFKLKDENNQLNSKLMNHTFFYSNTGANGRNHQATANIYKLNGNHNSPVLKLISNNMDESQAFQMNGCVGDSNI